MYCQQYEVCFKFQSFVYSLFANFVAVLLVAVNAVFNLIDYNLFYYTYKGLKQHEHPCNWVLFV